MTMTAHDSSDKFRMISFANLLLLPETASTYSKLTAHSSKQKSPASDSRAMFRGNRTQGSFLLRWPAV